MRLVDIKYYYEWFDWWINNLIVKLVFVIGIGKKYR